IILDKDPDSTDEKGQEAKIWVDKALGQNKEAAIVPGGHPIAVGPLLFFRSYSEITAIHLKPGTDEGRPYQAGDVCWKTTPLDGSLSEALAEPKNNHALSNWLTLYERQPGFLGLVYENSLVGTLATDHRLVYAIDDLAVPAPAHIFQQLMWANPN